MSTHAVLGIKYPDGRIDGCYVHFDGDSMLSRIEGYLESYTTTCLAVLIARAQAVGGIRSFHCPPSSPVEMPPETEFLDGGEPYVITETLWDCDHMGARYRYLVDYETGAIQKCNKSISA